MAKIISLFNHKGGVSKTTTAFNLGWKIAQKGYRVLLVDCDPQCNLTGLVLGYKYIDDSGIIEGNDPKNPLNIKEGLMPAFESRPIPIHPVHCLEVPKNDRLFLLPGHIGLAEYEGTLGFAQDLSGSIVTLRNLPGSIRYLINKTAEEKEIDIVLVDMSPSIGPINQNLVAVSDFFIIPMNPDYFAIMAIKSLSRVLSGWKKWADAARAMPVLRDAEYPFPDVSPKFLGYVIQKYRPHGGVSPAKAFQEWIDKIEKEVSTQLIPAFKQSNLMLDDEAYSQCGFEHSEPLIQMPDFNALIARSQECQVPVFALEDWQLKQNGTVLDKTKESMKNFDRLFDGAATRVMCMVRNAKGN